MGREVTIGIGNAAAERFRIPCWTDLGRYQTHMAVLNWSVAKHKVGRHALQTLSRRRSGMESTRPQSVRSTAGTDWKRPAMAANTC